VESGAFAAEDQDAVSGEVEAVVVRGSAFVETDDPEVVFFEVFEGADEVDDAGDAEVFGCSGAGLDGDGAEGGGAAFGEDDAVYAGAVGYAEEGAKVLRVFNAVEGEEEAGCGCAVGGCWRMEEVLDAEQFLRADYGDYALVGCGSGELGELVAGLLANADAGFSAFGEELLDAGVVALAGDEDVVEAAAAGAQGFFDGVEAVEDFHLSSVEGYAARGLM